MIVKINNNNKKNETIYKLHKNKYKDKIKKNKTKNNSKK